MPIYRETLARIHAEAFGDTFAPGFGWLADQIAATAPEAMLLDAGCGDGAWLTFARQAGIAGCGIDQSPEFVAMARRRGVSARVGDLNTATLPGGVTAVTALGEVLAYEPAALWAFAAKVAQALPRGGLLLFDVVSRQCRPGHRTAEGSDWRLDVGIAIAGDILERRIDVETADGTVSETHRLRFFDAQDVKNRLEMLGFSVDILDAYGPCALLEGRFAIRAERI